MKAVVGKFWLAQHIDTQEKKHSQQCDHRTGTSCLDFASWKPNKEKHGESSSVAYHVRDIAERSWVVSKHDLYLWAKVHMKLLKACTETSLPLTTAIISDLSTVCPWVEKRVRTEAFLTAHQGEEQRGNLGNVWVWGDVVLGSDSITFPSVFVSILSFKEF